METVLRGIAVYLVLLLIFRIAGKRTLHQTTTFDFVLILIVAETVQQAMIGQNNSFTNALVLVCTLVGVNILFSLLKQSSPRLDRILEGAPVVLVDRGKFLKDIMTRERVEKHDIMTAAREAHGLETFDDIKYAVLEKDGRITIVPREGTTRG
jgi:uncharacterized membrane protein YcaP (DUF421 family)